MKKFGDFFNRIKFRKEENVINDTVIEKKNKKIHIQIDGDTGLFKDEKEQIINGAKSLLEMGRCDDMVDAIITFATMFRGLRFQETKENAEGEVVVVLKDSEQKLKPSSEGEKEEH